MLNVLSLIQAEDLIQKKFKKYALRAVSINAEIIAIIKRGNQYCANAFDSFIRYENELQYNINYHCLLNAPVSRLEDIVSLR